MRRLRRLMAKWAGVFRNSRAEEELSREIAAHLALLEERFRERGMTDEGARRAARRAYGGVEQAKQMHRNERSLLWLEHSRQNVRYAIRQLRKSPGFTAVAVGTLALGIGAVTSVFSVVNGVLLKPFAYREPDRLVVLREMEDEIQGRATAIPFNYRHYQHLRETAKTLEDAVIFQQGGESVSAGANHPRIVGAVTTSASLFRVMGVEPALGRSLIPSDSQKGAQRVVVLSYEGWEELFQRSPQVVGQSVRLSGEATTVVGVLPRGFRFPQIAMSPEIAYQQPGGTREPMVYSPLVPSEWDLKADTGNFNYKVIARLRQGVKQAQARAELDALQRTYSDASHLPFHLRIVMTPLAADVTSGISKALWLLMAAVAGVLLIGCVNLANLQLARTTFAERETAVRAALGANSRQLIMARMTESLVLAAAGGAVGVGLAFAGVRILLALAPGIVPRANEVEVSWQVLGFATGISMMSALLFGTLPALRSLRVAPQTALQANPARTANTQEGRRTRTVLVAAEVACTLVLLMVTSLVLRSFSRLLHQDRGFDTHHVTAMQVDLYSPQYSDKLPNVKVVKQEFMDRVEAALKQLPGVETVGIASALPLTGQTWVDELIRPDHPVPQTERPLVNVRFVNPEYMATMQIPLLAGRNFADSDRNNPNVALISERTAKEAFGREDPVGRKIAGVDPDDDSAATVIGIVADARINGLKDTAPMVYLPHWIWPSWTQTFLVKSTQGSDAVIPAMRSIAWKIDPQVAIPTLRSLDDQLSDSVAADRFQVVVLTSFAACGLLLALMGVYGVLSYSVTLRRQEFGIRVALGSQRSTLMRLVLRQASIPVGLGAGTGLVIGFVVVRWVRGMLYETAVTDPVSHYGKSGRFGTGSCTGIAYPRAPCGFD